MTTIPVARAKLLGIPYPPDPIPNLYLAGTTEEIRAGEIRVRVVGMDDFERSLPCYFVGDPQGSPDLVTTRMRPNLLGLTGVVDQIRIIFDGTSSALALHGIVAVETL